MGAINFQQKILVESRQTKYKKFINMKCISA